MRYVSLKRIKSLAVCPALLALTLSSCALNSNGESHAVSVSLPGARISFMQKMENLTDWISLAWASATTATTLNTDPSSLSEFDCFAVNVTGPGIDPDPRVSCTDPGDAPAILGGFVPYGNSSIDLMVPAGPSRNIKIFGVKSLVGCPQLQDMLNGGAIQFNGNIGHMYEVGGATHDIFNDDSVTINVTYNSSSPNRVFSHCTRTGEGGTTETSMHLWSAYAGTGPATVNATKTMDKNLYIGGTFDYVGPTTMRGTVISRSTGDLLNSSAAHIGGSQVNCATPDGLGGFYVGGYFSMVESTNVSNLVHVRADGSFDATFTAGTNSTVSACAFDGTNLYIGGSFTQVTLSDGNHAVNGLAAIKVSDQSFQAFTTTVGTGGVSALALDKVNQRLYVGGSFTTPHNYAAAYNTSTLSYVSAWNPNPSNPVTAIGLSATKAYLGGSFSTVNTSTSRSKIAEVDLTTGTATTWNPTGLNYSINSIAVGSAYVYISVSTSPTTVQKINLSDSTVSTIFTTGTGEYVNTLALVEGTVSSLDELYVGGKFLASGHQNLLSILDPSNTATVRPTFVANSNKNTQVYTITPNAIGQLFVGGSFDSIGGSIRRNLAALDLTTGETAAWDPGLTTSQGAVTALESDGTSLYAAYDTNGSSAAGVLKYTSSVNASAWEVLTSSTEHIYTLKWNNGELYVAGQFAHLGGQTHSNLARLNSAGAVDTWNPTFTGSTPYVRSILVNADGSRIYAAGSFTGITSTTSAGLVAIDGTSGAVATGWTNPGYSSGVSAIAFAPSGNLIVAGAGGTTLTIVNPNTGANIAWASAPSLSSALSGINNLTVLGNTLLIGGSASSAGGAAVAFDLSSQQIMTGWLANIGNSGEAVNSFELLGTSTSGLLFIGGNFRQVNFNNPLPGGKMTWGIGAFDLTNGMLY